MWNVVVLWLNKVCSKLSLILIFFLTFNYLHETSFIDYLQFLICCGLLCNCYGRKLQIQLTVLLPLPWTLISIVYDCGWLVYIFIYGRNLNTTSVHRWLWMETLYSSKKWRVCIFGCGRYLNIQPTDNMFTSLVARDISILTNKWHICIVGCQRHLNTH